MNRAKSAEIVFRDGALHPACSRRLWMVHMMRVKSLKVLGVTFTDSLSVTAHVDDVISSCARSTYAISVLRSHSMAATALQQVFHSVVISRLTYTPTPPRRGGALRRPLTDSVSTLSCVVLSALICGHPRRRQSHRRLATSALQPTTNYSIK